MKYMRVVFFRRRMQRWQAVSGWATNCGSIFGARGRGEVALLASLWVVSLKLFCLWRFRQFGVLLKVL